MSCFAEKKTEGKAVTVGGHLGGVSIHSVHSGPPASPHPVSLRDSSGFEPRDPPEDFWHVPLSPVQRGPLGFYKSRFIYSPGPWALPGIYRFLSGPVSGGNANRRGTRRGLPVLSAKAFHSFPGAPAWGDWILLKSERARSETPSVEAASGKWQNSSCPG